MLTQPAETTRFVFCCRIQPVEGAGQATTAVFVVVSLRKR